MALGTKDLFSETWVGSNNFAGDGGTGTTQLNGWYTVLGSGSVINGDSTDIADSDSGSSHILKTQKVSPNFNARVRWRTAGDNAISYFNCFVNITAEGLSNDQQIYLMRGQNAAYSEPWRVRLQQAGGNLKIVLIYYSGDTDQTSTWTSVPSLSTWYQIEVYYDYTNSLWAWRINGIAIESGSLTGTLRAGPRDFLLGDSDFGRTVTAYFHYVNASTNGWQTVTASTWIPKVIMVM